MKSALLKIRIPCRIKGIGIRFDPWIGTTGDAGHDDQFDPWILFRFRAGFLFHRKHPVAAMNAMEVPILDPLPLFS